MLRQMSKDLRDLKGYFSKTKLFLSSEHKLGSSCNIDTEKVDFKKSEAMENICKWVEGNGIQNWDIKKYISNPTKYVLINISNLKMAWYAGQSCGSVMTIYNTFSYTEDIKYEARILELPLQNKDFKVIILVPNELDVLHKLFNKLIKEGFNAATCSIQPLFTALSELKAPKIEFQAINQLILEGNNCDTLPKTCISFGHVKINNNGAFVNCITCVLSEKSTTQAPSITKKNMEDSCNVKPFLFAINYRDKPIFTGQYVSPE
ncbi:serpin B3-like isoform X2 [Zerene cesonia]|uniref:serpin B3-like isoform X2 n=1 Tax=Zerene cesonia TaxID=33412 RepID=UPI0018E550E5|nr:serpin B3-like isoform X2 [Zerene cesonia]